MKYPIVFLPTIRWENLSNSYWWLCHSENILFYYANKMTKKFRDYKMTQNDVILNFSSVSSSTKKLLLQ
jgi:hypothetical protein